MARAGRSNHRGTSVGLVPPVGNRMVVGFTDELIWSVQIAVNIFNSVWW